MDGSLLPSQHIRALLDANPMVGIRKTGTRRFWTTHEVAKVKEHYPVGGVTACLSHLPGRTAASIYQRAGALGLIAPSQKVQRAGIPRQRYASSEAIDRVIRDRFPACTSRGAVAKLAETLMRPSWWVSKRALYLGCKAPRFKEPPWQAREEQILREQSGRSLEHIQRVLKKENCCRTLTAIKVKMRRLAVSTRLNKEGAYTARDLGELMGIDSHVIAGWVNRGLMKARILQADGSSKITSYLITHEAVKRFVMENVALVDIRKVDKFWFVDLLAGSVIGRTD